MKNYILIIFSVVLSGCMAIPKTEAVGMVSDKDLSFPKLNQKIYVVTEGLVHIKTSYKSGYRYKLKFPYDERVQMGMASVKVNANEDLIPSILEEREYHCASTNAYRDLIGFGNRNVCFLEENGKFTKMRYAPGAYWFTQDITPPIEVIKTEIILSSFGSYAKKELSYGGSSKNLLMFFEKEYTSDLSNPSKIKPIAIAVESTPKSIEISGAQIKVLDFSGNSLTFILEKAFD